MGTRGTYRPCPACRDRGGHYLNGAWVRCSTCKPRNTRGEAREAALHRYLSGNQNELAKSACMNLGFSERQLAEALENYRGTYQPRLEGL